MRLEVAFDVSFAGFCGPPGRGMDLSCRASRPCALSLPRFRNGACLAWSSSSRTSGGGALPLGLVLFLGLCGFIANFVMDSRGQGASWSPGDTSDRRSPSARPSPVQLTAGHRVAGDPYDTAPRIMTIPSAAVEAAASPPRRRRPSREYR